MAIRRDTTRIAHTPFLFCADWASGPRWCVQLRGRPRPRPTHRLTQTDRNGAGQCQIMDNSAESAQHGLWDGAKQMKSQADDDRRPIARRIFAALCARYPDRYIALIEQPPVHPPELATASPAESNHAIAARSSRPRSSLRPPQTCRRYPGA